MAKCKECGDKSRCVCEECAEPICTGCSNICYCGRILCKNDMRPGGSGPCAWCRDNGIEPGIGMPHF